MPDPKDLWYKNAVIYGVDVGLFQDGNGDGMVNDLDYAIWRSNFGNTSGTTAGTGSLATLSAPEPSGVCMAVFGILLLASCRGKSV